MFLNFLSKIFKHKVTVLAPVVSHTHVDVDGFLKSFEDDDLNMMRSELIGCERAAINEHITDILNYLKDKCTDEDFAWISEEMRKEYKN